MPPHWTNSVYSHTNRGGCFKIPFFLSFLVQHGLFIVTVNSKDRYLGWTMASVPTRFFVLITSFYWCFYMFGIISIPSLPVLISLFHPSPYISACFVCSLLHLFLNSLFQPSILIQSVSLGIITCSDQSKSNVILGLAAQTGSENLQFLLASIRNKPVQQHRISAHRYFKKLSLSVES